MISNEELRKTFLSDAMKSYFEKKLSPLPPSEVGIRVEELLKYLTMLFHRRSAIPFSEEIDEIWHLWILQTYQYEELCTKLPNGGFLHHSSNDFEEFFDPSVKSRTVDLQRGISVLASYVMNYGAFEKDRVVYWPLALGIMQCSGWSLAELNAWLGSVGTVPREQTSATEGSTAQTG